MSTRLAKRTSPETEHRSPRKDQTMIGCWLDPQDATRIRQIAIRRGVTLQALVEGALLGVIAEDKNQRTS